MTNWRWFGGARCPPGHQRHHLIPRAVLMLAQLGHFLANLQQECPALCSFAANGLPLPGNERLAAETGFALHRGPHPAYTDVVMARVDRIRASSALACRRSRWLAAARIATLQCALRRALTDRHGHRFLLNRCDPMRLFADRAYLDNAITALFGDD